MGDNIKRFTTPMGTFIQLEWTGEVIDLVQFLSVIGEDLLLDGWGYDTGMKGISPPHRKTIAWPGAFIAIAIDRPKTQANRYSVGSFDLTDMYLPEGQKKEPGTFIKEVYTYDGLGIPYGGEIFHRHRKNDRFYFWLDDTTRGRRKAFIDETAPAMQTTLTDLKRIWAQYGEQKK